jgi:hypothetical protein
MRIRGVWDKCGYKGCAYWYGEVAERLKAAAC